MKVYTFPRGVKIPHFKFDVMKVGRKNTVGPRYGRVRERKCEMAERVHRTHIGCLRPNANPNAFVQEKEFLYQEKSLTSMGARR